MTIPTFDQLYVVSDLHLGGNPGFQIFNQGSRLAAVIKRLAQPSDKLTGLVLNGDIVDFLAEEQGEGKYLDPDGAVEKLKRIYEDEPAFSMVWEALEAFVATPHCCLVLVLGNHDVELALPHVREWLLGKLSKGDAAARGRIVVAMDGAGYACKVGGKRVLCLHGNEVDTTNIVDYLALLKVARAINRGGELPQWDGNAGTHVVIDVMNKVKKAFPVVDLLKPEFEAALPIIIALDGDRISDAAKLLPAIGSLSRDLMKKKIGLLSAKAEAEKEKALPSEAEATERFLAENFEGYRQYRQVDVGTLLKKAYENIDAGNDPKGPISGRDANLLGGELLGVMDSFNGYLKEKKKEALQQALRRWLTDDKSFDISHKDSTYKQLDETIGPTIDYLIAGHTHLERAIERTHPGRYYFNSGTWIRLIQLKKETLDNDEQFGRVFAAFQAGTIAALEPIVQITPTVVSIVREKGRTCGQLNHAQPNGELVMVEGSRDPRS